MPSDIQGKRAILCDPLVATAETAIAAIERLKSYEVADIRILSILISEFAAKKIAEAHPDVKIFAVCVEHEMNEQGYLVPGLGDAGDRLYQTK